MSDRHDTGERPAESPGGCKPTLHVGDDLAAMAGPLVRAAIEETLSRTGRCRLALSGGSTPAPLYAWLKGHIPARWYPQLLITWVDERHLPVQGPAAPGDWRSFHADSNLRLAYEHWLGAVPLAPERVLPMSLGGSLTAEVLRFGRAFEAQFDGGIDIAILGVGADGHIASLFADHPGLAVDDLCFAVHDSPKPPAERITLALPVLNACACCVVLAGGVAKAATLAAAYASYGVTQAPMARQSVATQTARLPLARLAPRGALHWVIDRPAATGILMTWLTSIATKDTP